VGAAGQEGQAHTQVAKRSQHQQCGGGGAATAAPSADARREATAAAASARKQREGSGCSDPSRNGQQRLGRGGAAGHTQHHASRARPNALHGVATTGDCAQPVSEPEHVLCTKFKASKTPSRLHPILNHPYQARTDLRGYQTEPTHSTTC
jgi:hypothetical protein